MIIKLLFWFSFFIVFYTYIGYGILIWGINFLKGIFSKPVESISQDKFEPKVALIIAAFNEEDYISDKIKNTLELDYPKGKLHVYIITDGSNDSTPAIVTRYPQITLFHQPERRGKAAAMNRAIQLVNEPFVVFCDANTMLNLECIKEIIAPYANPKVGAVAGEKKIFQPAAGKAASAGEGLYWKYESFLKKQDARLYSVVGAAGELFSVRRELYQPIETGSIIEDFVLSLRIAMKGYVVQYAPGAYALEAASASIKEEQKRKVRICAGGFQAMVMLKGLFNIFKYGILSFQYISHRVLRWSVTPVFLFLLFPLNLVLVFNRAGIIYDLSLVGQLLFYILGFTGWYYANRNVSVKALYVPYYFLFMNISVFAGFKRFIGGKQTVLWDKAAREKIA